MNGFLWFGLGQLIIGLIALAGIFLGAVSFLYPDHSLELYQLLMQIFNWNVQPIDYRGEIRRTKIFGAIIFVISVAIMVVLFRPQLVVPAL